MLSDQVKKQTLTWEEEALKKVRMSFQMSRYPRMQQYSSLRGCTTANSPTCRPPRIPSKSSSIAARMGIRAAGGELWAGNKQTTRGLMKE